MSSVDPQYEQYDLPPEPVRGKRPRRRRRPWLIVLISLASLLAVLLAVAGIYLGMLGSSFDQNRQTIDAGIETEEQDDGVLNILVLGSDSRGEGQDTAENKGEDGARSDTMMLVHVPQDRDKVYVISIVRDLWVEIPGNGERKVNAAMSLGGYPLVAQTVEELTGAHVDHLAVIDFEGFNGLTEALGGVELDNPTAFSAGVRNPSYFPQGEILLNGTDALRYVRERKAFTDGDFTRVQNQQRYVAAVMDRLMTVDTLANPQRVSDVVNSLTPYIGVDDGLTAGTIGGYVWSMRDVRSNDVEMLTVPHGAPAEGPGGASIVLQDPEGMEQLRQALQNDTMDEFVEQQEKKKDDDGASSSSASPTTGAGSGATSGG